MESCQAMIYKWEGLRRDLVNLLRAENVKQSIAYDISPIIARLSRIDVEIRKLEDTLLPQYNIDSEAGVDIQKLKDLSHLWILDVYESFRVLEELVGDKRIVEIKRLIAEIRIPIAKRERRGERPQVDKMNKYYIPTPTLLLDFGDEKIMLGWEIDGKCRYRRDLCDLIFNIFSEPGNR